MARSITLDRKRIYILPNRHGMMMAVVLLVMLATSLNYGISLGFAFTFLLAGVFMVSFFHTYRNLHGLTFTPGQAPPTYAGGVAHFPISVDNTCGPLRQSLSLSLPDQQASCRDIAANTMGWLTLSCPAPRRGWLTLGACHVSTTFPLGLVRGWSILKLEVACLVYPTPAAEVPPLPLLPYAEGGPGGGQQEGEDFQGLRDYQFGDSAKRIHWKSYARQGSLHVKQFGGHSRHELWLDFAQQAPLDGEARLSRLCRWVLQADQSGHLWGLRLPEMEIPLSSGEKHRHACLRALALHGMNDKRHG